MADTLDLVTLEEGYQAINDDQSATTVAGGQAGANDDDMARFITAISRRIDELAGPVVIREIADERHDGGRDWATGRHWIELDHAPVDSITTLTEYDETTATVLTAETNAVKPADAYLLEQTGLRAIVRRRSSNGDALFPAGRRNVTVTYQAGRFAATESVDAQFKVAAAAVLRRLWTREAGAWAGGADPLEDPANLPAFFVAVGDALIAELLGSANTVPAGVA